MKKPKVFYHSGKKEKKIKEEEKKVVVKKSFKKIRFPKNYRFITERKTWLWASIVLSILILSLLSVKLYQVYQIYAVLSNNRKELAQQLTEWTEITKKYPSYRDAYIEAAILAYKLGDKVKAGAMIEKALMIDPTFEALYHFGK
ncbi:MAG TPA: hypothetical protein VFQ63_00940 [Patescibacteria group bacterium]|nr:hypothetical protein [Patescibacteria group bacterium]